MLLDDQRKEFWDKGYIVVRGAVSSTMRQSLMQELDSWIEESRKHSDNWGEQPNGLPRFDLETGHSALSPKLRRVNNPADISETYKDFIFNGPVPDLVVALIGPNVKFHHCKLNIKLPGMMARFDYHQDHVFSPQTNDDVVTCILMLDRMDEENGCLKIVPGSHRQRFSHSRGNHFAGSIDPALYDRFNNAADNIVGQPGDLCLMHTWAVHGSEPNRSKQPRRLFVADYTAADAFPIAANNAPSIYLGHIVRGTATRMARIKAGHVELPQSFKETSYFERQGQPAAYRG